jgi:hypothetical protein
MKITGNRIAIDDSLGIAQIEGNGVVVDKKNNTTIIGGLIYRNKNTEAIFATNKPLMIIQQEKDTIYITADTLYSARLSDRFGNANNLVPDTGKEDKIAVSHETDSTKTHIADTTLPNNTIGKPATRKSMADKLKEKNLATIAKKDSVAAVAPDTLIAKQAMDKPQSKDSVIKYATKDKDTLAVNEKDSTNRYFEAYRHVRIFSDSLQSVCDSMFYSFKDSIFRLYRDPVVWANSSQVTGDTILLFTKNKKADKVEAFENSFLVNRVENDVYNQIKSARMDGWFVDGNIDSVRAKAFAECIYYIQDEDSAYTGVNQSQCDIIDIYFQNKELDKVVFRSAVTGTLWPISQKNPAEMQLEGFRWLEARRPKTKFEMFE